MITIMRICDGTSATGQESISPSYIVYGKCCGPQNIKEEINTKNIVVLL
jgi:hypothetical protein